MGCLTATTARRDKLSVVVQRENAINALCARLGDVDIKLYRQDEISAHSARVRALAATSSLVCSLGNGKLLATEDGYLLITENKELLTI